MPTGKLEKLIRMGRTLRAQRGEAKLLRDDMPHDIIKVVWTKQVIDPLTTAIDNIEVLLTKAKKLKRKQGFVQADDTFGGLL